MHSNPVSATVHDIKPLSGDVWQVLLKPIDDYPYQAGQFTELLIEGFEFLYFTIASAPHTPCVELHIQGGSDTNNRLISHLQSSGVVQLAQAGGDCTITALPKEQGPLLLVASGTGFSQVKAIVEQSIHEHWTRPLHIYWASYKLSQLYMLEKAECWAEKHNNIHMAALISEHSHWQDKHQMLLHSIIADHTELAYCQAIFCGSPEMVYSLFDVLTDKGLRPEHVLSDVFVFAPRDAQ